MIDFSYDAWPSGEPYDWTNAARGDHPHDLMDHHVDLGCGTIKKGRIGIDHMAAPGVNIVCNLENLRTSLVPMEKGHDAAIDPGESTSSPYCGLPFEDNSIKSIFSHHCLEHIGEGFLPLMDECYRVLEPGGLFRICTPLFPSTAAVQDPDHKRYFMEGTFESFCGTPGNCWLESFSVPYTKARFTLEDKFCSPLLPVEERFGPTDHREIRVSLRANK